MAIPFAVRDFNFHLKVFAKFMQSKHFSANFYDDSVAALI